MTVGTETVRQAKAARIALDHTADDVTRKLAGYWSTAWQELVDEWQTAVADLATSSEWPSHRQILQSQRVTAALNHTGEQLVALADTAGVTITGELPHFVALADNSQQTLFASQLGAAAVSVSWSRANPGALEAIVKRVTGQVESLARLLPADQQAAMKASLVRGVAVGENPLDTAQRMVDRLGGVFNGGVARAENIARTEMLDAYREAGRASRAANTDVLTGWMWSCDLSSNVCPACLAMDGQIFPLDTPGPLGHQQCRCTAVPVSKSWTELGIDAPEPAPTRQTGRDWYLKQPWRTQERIMGRDRAAALRSGDLRWEDIPERRRTPGWRDSIVTRKLPAHLRAA